MNMNNKEKKILGDPFFDWIRSQEARRVFSEFVGRVKDGAVKNDGSDELLSIIDEVVLDCGSEGNFYKTLKKKTKLYRARVIKDSLISQSHGFNLSKEGNIAGLNESESREAPLGFSAEGRNNIKGVSYFYASDKITTACCEVKPGIRQLVSVAEFEINKTMHFIDFSSDKLLASDTRISLGRLFSDIMFMYYQPVVNVEEYRATQVLTDYIRKTGIDGIMYRSYYDASGINYTIFNSDHRLLSFMGSTILLFQSERKSFLDINNRKVIQAESVGGASYDEEVRNSIFGNIVNTLNKNRN